MQGIGSKFIAWGEENAIAVNPKVSILKTLFEVVVPDKVVRDPSNGTFVARRHMCFYEGVDFSRLDR